MIQTISLVAIRRVVMPQRYVFVPQVGSIMPETDSLPSQGRCRIELNGRRALYRSDRCERAGRGKGDGRACRQAARATIG